MKLLRELTRSMNRKRRTGGKGLINMKYSEIKYILIETFIGDDRCYGIAAIVDSDSFPTIIDHVIDIYRDKKQMLEVVDMCNSFKLDPIHLRDFVYDII